MDLMAYSEEEAKFMKEKSLGVINRINNSFLRLDDVNFEFHRLDGISNKIFKVSIINKNDKSQNDLFFKIFGRISSKKIYLFIN